MKCSGKFFVSASSLCWAFLPHLNVLNHFRRIFQVSFFEFAAENEYKRFLFLVGTKRSGLCLFLYCIFLKALKFWESAQWIIPFTTRLIFVSSPKVQRLARLQGGIAAAQYGCGHWWVPAEVHRWFLNSSSSDGTQVLGRAVMEL